jgi:methionine synthase II (cobalamin-independent)
MAAAQFSADHFASLLRPGLLRQAFKQLASGQATQAEFIRIQDESI